VKQAFFHPWDLSPQEASKLQEELREKIILKIGVPKVKRIAGADISFSQKTSRAYAAVIVFSFPDNRRLDEESEARRQLEILEEQHTIGNLTFPYIPGLLTFREGPLLIEAFKKIKIEPDIIIFDGQGIAHPKRLGLATHMGILLDKPTIGCAKSRLIGTYQKPEREKNSYSLLRDDGEIIGKNPVWIFPTESTNFLRIEGDVDSMIFTLAKISVIPRDSSAYHTGMLDINEQAKILKINIMDATPYSYVSVSNIVFSTLWIAIIIGIFAALKRKKDQLATYDEAPGV